ncbi:glycine zipper 2TM domain-containing protein [bacterium]|nr:glycine zipper 2TM domain-containing protein [bacterium]
MTMTQTSPRPQKAFAAVFAAMTMVLAGCASGLGANSYERGQVGAVSRVDEGTVVASRTIIIEGRDGVVGGATGAVVGGIAGSQIGGGRDERAIAGVLGAVVGGIAGSAIENSATKKPGFAYTVRLRSGELITVTQGGDLAIANGTPVLVEYGQRARIIPQNISYR